jgi:hypothetical protein
MKALAIEQSLPICCSLAVLGGILEVAATAVTAVPSVREKEGIVMKWWVQGLAIAGNVALQAAGSLLSHLVATWYGPVSLVVPFFYSATLLSNMMIFGLLGEHFTKNMRVGTHVIVVAVILLPIVGPDIQEGQDITALMRHSYSIAWFVFLLVAGAVTGVLLVSDISKYEMRYRVAILLVARAASISVNLTVSRAFILGLPDALLVTFVIIKLVSGATYTYAIVVQSFTVEQASFVPLNATTIIIVNALTGIVIWEDWRVMSSWYGYICIFFLLGLGCDMLLSVPLLNAENPEFGATKRASLIIPRQSRRFAAPFRESISTSPPLHHDEYGATLLPTTPVSRIDAWKQVVSPIEYTSFLDDKDTGLLVSTYSPRAETPTPYGSTYATPQRMGTAVQETELLLAHHPPTWLDGQPMEPTTRTVPANPPHQLLSRLAAWRETVSPNARLSYCTQRKDTSDPGSTIP